MKIIGDMKIGKRLAFGFAIILAFSIVITAIGIWRLQAVSDATNAMMAQPLLKERVIGDWYANLHSGIRRTIAIAKSSDPALGPYFAEEAPLLQDLRRVSEKSRIAVEFGCGKRPVPENRRIAQGLPVIA